LDRAAKDSSIVPANLVLEQSWTKVTVRKFFRLADLHDSGFALNEATRNWLNMHTHERDYSYHFTGMYEDYFPILVFAFKRKNVAALFKLTWVD
jgi:hypothetical protein